MLNSTRARKKLPASCASKTLPIGLHQNHASDHFTCLGSPAEATPTVSWKRLQGKRRKTTHSRIQRIFCPDQADRAQFQVIPPLRLKLSRPISVRATVSFAFQAPRCRHANTTLDCLVANPIFRWNKTLSADFHSSSGSSRWTLAKERHLVPSS